MARKISWLINTLILASLLLFVSVLVAFYWWVYITNLDRSEFLFSGIVGVVFLLVISHDLPEFIVDYTEYTKSVWSRTNA